MSERYCYACRRPELDCACAERETAYAADERGRRDREQEDWDAYCDSMGLDHRGFGSVETERSRAERDQQIADRARHGEDDS